MSKGLIHEADVEEVKGDGVGLCVLLLCALCRLQLGRFRETLEEVGGFGMLHVEFQFQQHLLLHFNNLIARELMLESADMSQNSQAMDEALEGNVMGGYDDRCRLGHNIKDGSLTSCFVEE